MTAMLSPEGRTTDWISDREPLNTAISAVIGNRNYSQGLPNELIALVTGYLREQNMFGEKAWEALKGCVAPPPPLPLNIDVLWHSPCPLFSGKRVRETHTLFYLPKTIEKDKALSLENLYAWAAHNYRHSFETIQGLTKEQMSKSIDNSCWLLIPVQILTNSNLASAEDKSAAEIFEEQSKLVPEFYEVPNALEAAVYILAVRLISNTLLFDSTGVRCLGFQAPTFVNIAWKRQNLFSGRKSLVVEEEEKETNRVSTPVNWKAGIIALRRLT